MATEITGWSTTPAPKAPAGTLWGGSAAPTSTYYTGGGSFGVGVNPTPPRSNPQPGGTFGAFMPPGGQQAMAGAYQQANQSFNQATGALAPGRFMGSSFAQGLNNMFNNPTGMDPRALEQQNRMAAEMFAGSRDNNLLRMQQRATASGFGDSASLMDAESRLRAGSAADLNNAYTQNFIQKEMMKARQRESAMQYLTQVLGMEAGAAGQLASLYAGRQFPVIPGVTPGPTGASGAQGVQVPGSWWSQGGQYQTGPMPYDPYKQGGGYTPQNPWKPW